MEVTETPVFQAQVQVIPFLIHLMQIIMDRIPFVVQISDGNSGTDTITVNVTINNVNDPPVITEGATISQTVNEDNTLNFTLNATDIDNDTITWSISTNGSNGTASTSGTGTSNSISYTPRF
jgi:Flp pilus assembly protein TadG